MGRRDVAFCTSSTEFSANGSKMFMPVAKGDIESSVDIVIPHLSGGAGDKHSFLREEEQVEISIIQISIFSSALLQFVGVLNTGISFWNLKEVIKQA